MNFSLTSWLCKGAIAIALLAGVLYMVFDNGRTYERARAEVKAAAVARQAAERYQAELDRARAAALDYSQQHAELRAKFDNLQERMDEIRKRNPIVVTGRKLPASAIGKGNAGASGQLSTSSAGTPHGVSSRGPAGVGFRPIAASAADLGALGPDDDVEPQLSLAAVRLWNSALAGVDLPAGACGIAGAAEFACAAASGIDFDAAWRNHQRNAESCALDRQRQQKLIDYLQGRRAFSAGASARP